MSYFLYQIKRISFFKKRFNTISKFTMFTPSELSFSRLASFSICHVRERWKLLGAHLNTHFVLFVYFSRYLRMIHSLFI